MTPRRGWLRAVMARRTLFRNDVVMSTDAEGSGGPSATRDHAGAPRRSIGGGEVDAGEARCGTPPGRQVDEQPERQPEERARPVQGPAPGAIPLADVALDRRVETE